MQVEQDHLVWKADRVCGSRSLQRVNSGDDGLLLAQIVQQAGLSE